jgi:hypothetical protein
MGTRYGGLKQIDPVGPGAETLLDYSVFDALRAGFGRVVFVIRRDIETAFREKVGRRYESRLEVAYAFQDLAALPEGFAPPPGRTKPWGTGQAVLSAEPELQEAFAVANADDFYGAESFRRLGTFLAAPGGKRGGDQYAVVGFELGQTLSPNGPVARGILETRPGKLLSRVQEVLGLVRDGERARAADGRSYPLETRVSLNLWGFTTALFAPLREAFLEFLHAEGRDQASEFFLPDAIDRMIAAARATVQVLPTRSPWFGITHRADLPLVKERIAALVRGGDYPERLFPS